ncbi:MAG: hypothetical protein WA708_00035 [Acidobacteriaceae bacterium]
MSPFPGADVTLFRVATRGGTMTPASPFFAAGKDDILSVFIWYCVRCPRPFPGTPETTPAARKRAITRHTWRSLSRLFAAMAGIDG